MSMTPDNQPALLPCPFCGSEPIRYEYENNGGRFTVFNVLCNYQECPAEIRVESIERQEVADALWNRRAEGATLGEGRGKPIDCAHSHSEILDGVRICTQCKEYMFPDATPTAQRVAAGDEGLAEFTEYFVRNYPGPDTIISDPHWHAPRIFRAAQRAITPPPTGEAVAIVGERGSVSWRSGRILPIGAPLYDHPAAQAEGRGVNDAMGRTLAHLDRETERNAGGLEGSWARWRSDTYRQIASWIRDELSALTAPADVTEDKQ